MQRRLLIGVAATVVLGTFALVPTDSLRLGKPSKPLFLYLIPLVRVQVRLLLPLPMNTCVSVMQRAGFLAYGTL